MTIRVSIKIDAYVRLISASASRARIEEDLLELVVIQARIEIDGHVIQMRAPLPDQGIHCGTFYCGSIQLGNEHRRA